MPGNVLAIAQVDSSSDLGGIGINRYYMNFGLSGAPDATTLTEWSHLIMELYAALNTYIPNTVTYTIQPTVKVVDDESGGLITELAISSPAGNVTGSASADYPGGTGVRLYWHTGTISGRRFIRGATYITPLGGASYGPNGALQSYVVTAAQGAGASYVIAASALAGQPCIWHRPPKKTTTGGISGTIVSCTVTSQPGSLRSRRN